MYSRLHHESKYIAIVSHDTQDVSVCNVIVSEADMSGLWAGIQAELSFLNH